MLTNIFANFFVHYCFLYPTPSHGLTFFLIEVHLKNISLTKELSLKMSSLLFSLLKESLTGNGIVA